MSPQECGIDQRSRSQLEMMTNSTAQAPEQRPIPHHTGQLAWLFLGNSSDSLRQPSQVYRNINTAQELEESSMHLILSREES